MEKTNNEIDEEPLNDGSSSPSEKSNLKRKSAYQKLRRDLSE